MELYELRNNLIPTPAAHSPYGNSTLSPGSQGLLLTQLRHGTFNASATTPGSCCHWPPTPTLGLGVWSPRTYLPKQTFFTLYYRCKTVAYSSFSSSPPAHFSENFFWSPAFPFCFWSVSVLDLLFLLSPGWRRWVNSGTEEGFSSVTLRALGK